MPEQYILQRGEIKPCDNQKWCVRERGGGYPLISERKYELVGPKESRGCEEGTMLDKVACTIQWEAMGTVSEDAPWR